MNNPTLTLTRIRSYTVIRLVDVENLVGGSQFVERHNPWVLEELQRHSLPGTRQLTHIAVGVSVLRRAPELLWSWQGMRTLVGTGVDGADLRLSEVLECDPAAQTAERVEIWSGDHCFSAHAERARFRGAEVHVFSRPAALAQNLAKAATKVHLLHGPTSFPTSPSGLQSTVMPQTMRRVA